MRGLTKEISTKNPRDSLPRSAQFVTSPFPYMQHINIASYTYTPTETSIVTHTWIHTLGSHPQQYIHTHTQACTNTYSHTYVHKHNHMCLQSYAHTHTHKSCKTDKNKKVATGMSKIASFFLDTPHRKIQVGGTAMTPRVKLPLWLQKGLNIGWLVWIWVSSTLEGLLALWEPSISFRVRSYW